MPTAIDLKSSIADDTASPCTSSDTSMALEAQQRWGYAKASGIGKLEVIAQTLDWSPVLDNVRFGVPEPASLALLLIGAAALRNRAKRRTPA